MPEIVVSIPEELNREMKEFPEVNWSFTVNRLIKEEFGRLVHLKKIVSKSELAESDVKDISTKISQSLAKKYEQMS